MYLRVQIKYHLYLQVKVSGTYSATAIVLRGKTQSRIRTSRENIPGTKNAAPTASCVLRWCFLEYYTIL